MSTRICVLAALLALAGACSASTPRASPTPSAPASPRTGGLTAPSGFSADTLAEIDPALLAPLRMLPECPKAPEATDGADVGGLALPEGAVVTREQQVGPLTRFQGWIPMTPIQIRVHYQFEQTQLEPILLENEIHESESLLSDGARRLFVKAQAVCDKGSAFVAVVAPEAAASSVPKPAGAR